MNPTINTRMVYSALSDSDPALLVTTRGTDPYAEPVGCPEVRSTSMERLSTADAVPGIIFARRSSEFPKGE